MAKYRIHVKQFCTLSNDYKWQGWLQSVSPTLHRELMQHLAQSKSCRSNQEKMQEIQKSLDGSNKLPAMIAFLKREFPQMIEEIREEKDGPAPIKSTIVSGLEKNEVFSHYNPNLLTFPQRMVLENKDPEALKRDVKEFIVGKVGVDYLIIGDRAYIEYFKLKFIREASQVPITSRELYKYRLKKGLTQVSPLLQQGPSCPNKSI